MNENDAQVLDQLFAAGNLPAALQEANRLRQLHPKAPYIYNMLGAIYVGLGKAKAAAGYYRIAIQLKPDFVEANNNLGVALSQMGDIQGAIRSYQSALAANPRFSSAHLNLGNAKAELNRHNEAAGHFRTSILLNPKSEKAHHNLGLSLFQARDYAGAVEAYDAALRLNQQYAEAWYGKGLVITAIGNMLEAKECYRKALEIRPSYQEALSTMIFCEAYTGFISPEELKALSLSYGELVLANSEERSVESFTQIHRDERRKLSRIGFISADWGSHPVGHFTASFLKDLLPRLERVGISAILFSNRKELQEDSLTQVFKALPANWKNVSELTDTEFFESVRSEDVDILLDLSGHTRGNRLAAMAKRVAIVQASWLGYFATTGVQAMDFIIGDPYVTPDSESEQFVEKIARLPNSYLCFTPPDFDLEPGEAPCRSTGSITFGSLNNLSKMGPAVVKLWAEVLSAVEDSRLLLKSPQLADSAHQKLVENDFAAHGIEPDRLIFKGKSDREAHLATYQDIDIGLDPFPYPGGTTSCEALWMGVPVLTKKGDKFLSHVGESVAVNAGLDNWIAADEQDYVRKAKEFASNHAALADLRGKLREQLLCSPLCNSELFADNFVKLLQQMWESRQSEITQ